MKNLLNVQQLQEFRKVQKKMIAVVIGLGVIGYCTSLFTEGWVIFFPMAIILGIMLYQKRVGDMRSLLIKSVCNKIHDDLGMTCKEKTFDAATCKASFFFPEFINSFYLNMDTPRQVCEVHNHGCFIEFSILSLGEIFAKVIKVGKRNVIQSGAHGVTARIFSEGIFFRCKLPFSITVNRVFLPEKWGKHIEKRTLKNFVGASFSKSSPSPFELLKQEHQTIWCYGFPPINDDVIGDAFWNKIYVELQREYPFSLFSVIENSLYIYVPFTWDTSSKHLERCISEYQAIIEHVCNLIINELNFNSTTSDKLQIFE